MVSAVPEETTSRVFISVHICSAAKFVSRLSGFESSVSEDKAVLSFPAEVMESLACISVGSEMS